MREGTGRTGSERRDWEDRECEKGQGGQGVREGTGRTGSERRDWEDRE